MIEINLIPDVKQEFIHAQKMRNVTITFAILVGAAAGTAVVILALLLAAQTVHEAIARDQIKDRYNTLKAVDNIDNVLTIQNQLSKITNLHEKKTIDSRLFDVLVAINPAAPNDVKLSNIKVDPGEKTLTIEGSAVNGYAATETFRKTILNTKLESTVDGSTQTVALTEEVTIGETSYGEGPDGTRVLRFTVSFTYPDGLFDNSIKSPRILTPTDKVDVTDSRTRVPESLFSQKASDIKEGSN